ncbi:transketolase family protein [Paraburkholderia denitrificans]|uniref:Transketolase family protein n=1 Tax=Paraburkholderia denitrificans TaxID=694025 RepID=A0ABW0J700_9BURK
MREPFSTALINLGSEHENLVVLDGDCSHSTRTYRFADIYPQRFINAGIAEANMIGMAAGMSRAGLLPIVCGFAAILVHRAAEQLVQSIAYSNANVKVVGHYAGFTAASEGAPHHAISDLALVRAIPDMTILCPVDDEDVEDCLREAVETPGPVYLRLGRNPVPRRAGARWITRNGYKKSEERGSIVIFSTGGMCDVALETTERLRASGLNASLIAVRRIKPFPDALHALLASSESELIVTIEDHSTTGGLGGAISEALGAHGKPLLRFGVPDTFTQSGTYSELLRGLKLTASEIARNVTCLFRQKHTREMA